MSSSLTSSTFYNNGKKIYIKSNESQNKSKSKHNKISTQNKIHRKFINKYKDMPLSYNSNLIEKIMHNKKAHIVSCFKDYLFIDDEGEFLKRYYLNKEIGIRIMKITEFYTLYSKLFPNYIGIEEGKYLFKNIRRKQLIINIQENNENDNCINKNILEECNTDSIHNSKIFTTNAIDSLFNETHGEEIEILFNVKRDDVSKNEEQFRNGINNILKTISKFDNKVEKQLFDKKVSLLNLIKNQKNNNLKKIKKFHNNTGIFENIINFKKESKINLISKFLGNTSKIKNKNKNKNSNLINRYTNINLHHKNNSKNTNISKLNSTDRTLLDKFDIKQSHSLNNRNISQNMSTTMKTKKDISNRNSNIQLKKKNQHSVLTNNLSHLMNSKAQNSIKNIKKELINQKSSKLFFSSRNEKNNFYSNSINSKSITNKILYIKGKSLQNILSKKIKSIILRNYDSRNRSHNKENSSSMKGNSLFRKNNSNSRNKSERTNKTFLINKKSELNRTNCQNNNSNIFGNKKKLNKKINLVNIFKVANTSRNKNNILGKKNESRISMGSKVNTSCRNRTIFKNPVNKNTNNDKRNKILNIKINKLAKISKFFSKIGKNKAIKEKNINKK